MRGCGEKGFTLVEVVVALLVLEVGLLGVAGTLILAARSLSGARRTDAAAVALERVYDSLSRGGAATPEGRVPLGPAEVRWEASGGGGVLTVRYVVLPDSVVAELRGRMIPQAVGVR